MRGAEIDEKMRAAFGIAGSLKMSLVTPARKNVFAAQAKVQRFTQRFRKYASQDEGTIRRNLRVAPDGFNFV
ncbi:MULTISPECIES: hypothetical protein [Bradyrhizobium]|uniref:hypothetical protein n=1 Tax=Bradyrhizobium TaxID=374 RepID=UPI00157F801B|nr:MULTISPECIES: hypothetical protein [Bradyrhizobium]